MAALHQYYETDFSNTVRMHVRFPVEEENIEAVVLFDFVGLMAYVACYVPGPNRNLDFFFKLLQALEYGKTQMVLDGKITLPATKQFPGQLRVENKEDFEVLARFHGDPTWVSSKNIQATRRVFIYCEANLSERDIQALKDEAQKHNHDLQIRSTEYMEARTKQEQPLAFISHDSRDKDIIARKIAINLQKMLCPVWYDEFSLKIGDSLRESIEKGLKECKKCILILSHNFISNNGWTKKEFDSIFTREILEEKKLVLPVWYQVSKEQVYEYSPSLLNVKGANWESLGEEEVCRQLYRVIVD
jgi:hypothetical protein